MLRALVVDDESLARARLRALLAEADVDVEVVGEARSGKEAVQQIHALAPNVVFLDVQMPVLNGFDVLDLLPTPHPHVVFVTAFDAYALQAFDAHALDYLTKPVRLERLNRSLQHVVRLIDTGTRDPAVDALSEARRERPLRRLTVRTGRRLRVVDPEDVRYFEADRKLVFAHLRGGGRHSVDFSLQSLERRLGTETFVRIHRSYLVNTGCIREVLPWSADTVQVRLDDGAALPVARRRTSDVKALLGGR